MITGIVRPATQANRFYTGDAKALENEVDSLLMRHNSSQVYDNLAALIVPHAGYYIIWQHSLYPMLATISLEMWQHRPI